MTNGNKRNVCKNANLKKCILYFQTVHRFLKKASPATVIVIAVERYTSTAIVVTIIIIIAPL